VPVLATWGRRFAAYLLDGLILAIPFAVGLTVAVVGDVQGADALTAIGGFLIALWFLAQPVYYTVLTGRSGQTLGKRALGLRVIDERAGGTIGYGRAFVRWLIVFVMAFACWFLTILDGLWPLWDEKRQTWHDKVASSVVVKLPD
jgi:uncharacterized RDD family membrane protein YckC